MASQAASTLRVQRIYVWALEVLACDRLGIEGEMRDDDPERYARAERVVQAVLEQPLDRRA